MKLLEDNVFPWKIEWNQLSLMTPSLECVCFRIKLNTLGYGLRLDVISSRRSGRELDFASLPAGLFGQCTQAEVSLPRERPVEYISGHALCGGN